jgi:hypothetical protein
MTSGGSTGSLFGAGDAALGYLYQIRHALLESLQRLAKGQILDQWVCVRRQQSRQPR